MTSPASSNTQSPWDSPSTEGDPYFAVFMPEPGLDGSKSVDRCRVVLDGAVDRVYRIEHLQSGIILAPLQECIDEVVDRMEPRT